MNTAVTYPAQPHGQVNEVEPHSTSRYTLCMERQKIVTGEIYHIFNRGVDKRIIYTSGEEYAYFTHLLYILNSTEAAINTRRNLIQPSSERGSTSTGKRECVVDILAFVLMPNHFHLLLKQRVDGGIAKFMQKLGTGYTMSFNDKHERSGSLFQGRYKSVHIETDSQLLYIPHYIHMNPLSLLPANEDIDPSDFLMKYKWSSYQDYTGGHNFPSITKRDLILDLFAGSNNYISDISQFITQNKPLPLTDTATLIDADE